MSKDEYVYRCSIRSQLQSAELFRYIKLQHWVHVFGSMDVGKLVFRYEIGTSNSARVYVHSHTPQCTHFRFLLEAAAATW